MWTAEHSTVTTADPKALWSIWAYPEGWPKYDTKNLEWARIDGPFAVGSRILLKPTGARQNWITLTVVVPYERYTTESKVPFGKLTFDHFVTPDAKGNSIVFTHRLSITGPLTRVFRRLFADELVRSLPQTMDNIKRDAESVNAEKGAQ
jgi:Polyketide cyclase / dehydrase and lipid transport